jgi:GntR family transcriptional regulator
MEIRLNMSDGVPVYRQIVNQVKYLMASGRLVAGQELTPIRVLAERLVINPNTVVHAYAELVREGLVVSRHGSGTYVAEKGSRLPEREAVEILRPKVDALLADGTHLGMGIGELVKLVRDRHEALKRSERT